MTALSPNSHADRPRPNGSPERGVALWGGVEGRVNRVGDRFFDQLERSGHAHRPGDLDRFARGEQLAMLAELLVKGESLSDAVAHSYNLVIGKLALRHLDQQELSTVARAFMFETEIPFEFKVERSPAHIPPSPEERAKVAAGFWNVDLSPLHGAVMASILARGGQRVASVVMYLNTPARGGATTFPDARFEAAAVKGNAVFFSYDRPHPMTGTLHGGAPVLEGEKWVATKWLRERRYD